MELDNQIDDATVDVAPSATDPKKAPQGVTQDGGTWASDDSTEDSESGSIRDALNAAMEKASDSTKDAETTKSKPEPSAPKVEGKEAKNPETKQASGPKPPMDWGAEEAEAWKTLPESVKKRVTAREQQVNKMLNEGAQDRKLGAEVNQIANQFAPILQAENTDAVTALKNILGTVNTFRTGTKRERSARMADLIQTYDIDLTDLDAELSSRYKGEDRGGDPDAAFNQRVQQAVDQRMRPYQDQQRHQVERQADQQIANFAAKHEFFNHVQGTMETLLAGAAQQGQQMTLAEAYRQACRLDDGVQNVLRQRHEQKQQQRTSQKRNASSSVYGRKPQGGEPSYDPTRSPRDALMAAIDAHNS